MYVSTVNATLKWSRSLLQTQRVGSFPFSTCLFHVAKRAECAVCLDADCVTQESLHGGREHRQYCSKDRSGDIISDSKVTRLL